MFYDAAVPKPGPSMEWVMPPTASRNRENQAFGALSTLSGLPPQKPRSLGRDYPQRSGPANN
jgi:hypothetical protein